MAVRYSRVTVVGARRRLDTVLPADEPVGRLLPEVLVLLDEPVAQPPRPRQLVTRTGEVLGSEATLSAAGVADGAVLDLVGVDDSPPAPVVHDVTEDAADGLGSHAWRWGAAARRWTATAAVVLFAAAAAALVDAGPWLAAGALALCVAGGVIGRLREPVGTALVSAGALVGLQAGWIAAATWSPGARGALLAAVACGSLVAYGVASPVGRAGVAGGGLGLLLIALGWVATVAGLSAVRLAAVLAVLATVLIGLLPRLALAVAGLSRLDDRRTAGREVTRPEVAGALTAAHRTLTLVVVVCAGAAALAGWLLAAHADRWAAPAAGLLAVALASRARGFPLVGEVVALSAAAGAVLLGLLTAWVGVAGGPTAWMVAAVAGAGLVALAVLAVDPPAHVQARARRVADRIEAVAVIALPPVALGVFGVYSRLLHIF
ncbi:EsaB/YukD family protein [Asanoa sp. NPDC049573]|uniref:EsaB/YukD family protein n=1 Tax=Asanoa sp. NPDC049573 TaxID=3155396 RepID=UPI0034212C53